jgi:hypothetical protein
MGNINLFAFVFYAKVYSFSGALGMKGWIYVATMTNTVEVVKIGYSDRDPDEREKGSEWFKCSVKDAYDAIT